MTRSRQPLVLVTSRSFASGNLDVRADLTNSGVRVVNGPIDHDLEVLRPLLADTDAWIAGTGPVTDAHLAAAPRLRIVARYGVGVDAVDLAAAARRGVVVTNTPGANSGAVADHTIALILAALRNVVPGDRGVRADDWGVTRTRELGSLTVGIVGLGRIGRGVAQRLSGFNTTILAHDPWVSAAEAHAVGTHAVTLEEIAARSDVVSLHTPGTGVLVDAGWIARARRGLVLVNTARANLVDEAALAAALRHGTIGAYAADSLSTEGGHGVSPLLADDLADRVTLTPHSAAQTVEAVDRMGSVATRAVLAVLHGEAPPHIVEPRPTLQGETL